MDGEMQYSRRELSRWVNSGELPKRHLPSYMDDEARSLNIFGVIDHTLKACPEVLEALKEYVDGI